MESPKLLSSLGHPKNHCHYSCHFHCQVHVHCRVHCHFHCHWYHHHHQQQEYHHHKPWVVLARCACHELFPARLALVMVMLRFQASPRSPHPTCCNFSHWSVPSTIYFISILDIPPSSMSIIHYWPCFSNNQFWSPLSTVISHNTSQKLSSTIHPSLGASSHLHIFLYPMLTGPRLVFAWWGGTYLGASTISFRQFPEFVLSLDPNLFLNHLDPFCWVSHLYTW